MNRGAAEPSSRRALLGILAVLGAVPTATGLASVLVGTRSVAGGGATSASTDSEWRFVNVFWGAAGPLLWWTLQDPVERTRETRLVLGLAAAGGVARLLSWKQVGRPHPVYLGTLGLELSAVPLLLWHRAAFPLRAGSRRR
jgi:hypothetical protein